MSAAAKAKSGKRLGRGLDALLGAAPVSVASDDKPGMAADGPGSDQATQTGLKAVAAGEAAGKQAENSAGNNAPFSLPVAFLKPNQDQPRRVFNDDAIEELAASIKTRGLLQPILVRPLGKDSYEIVAGERRWRAAQRAKLHEAPVLIRDLSDEEAAEIALIENVQRVDLNPMEEAEAYKRLCDTYKRTQDQIAKAVGKSRSHVANIMRLLTLPEGARGAVLDGSLSMGHARALIGADDPDGLCAKVLKEGLSVRQTEALVKQTGIGEGALEGSTETDKAAAKKSGGKKDADTRMLEADLAAALGLEVTIDHRSNGSGSVTIDYLNLDQLDEVCRRLMDTGV